MLNFSTQRSAPTPPLLNIQLKLLTMLHLHIADFVGVAQIFTLVQIILQIFFLNVLLIMTQLMQLKATGKILLSDYLKSAY